MELTQEILRRFLRYDPRSGAFTWLHRPVRPGASGHHLRAWNTKYAGTQAGHVQQGPSGPYVMISLFKKKYLAHRLAWFYMTGKWPPIDIDHEDGDGLNNRWRNLRLATKSQNGANSGLQTNNASGFKGVNFNTWAKRYAARIMVRGKRIHLGYFDTPEEANFAYCAAAKQHFGEFARVN